MNTTIKKRIEEINSGLVPEGYQKTSFGIFPCDWQITKISDIAYLNKQKFDPQKNEDNPICIELEHIVGERGVLNGNTYAQNQLSLKNIFCKGDILFGKLRPYLGKYYHADKKGVCSTEIWVIRNHNIIDNNFLFQLVKDKRFIQYAQDSAFGTKMPRAEWQKIEKEEFAIPTSTQEQSRIAEILMQWDKAIALQEKYIEKLELRKKALMQRLLTPQKEWNKVKLGNIAKLFAGGTPSTSKKEYWGGDIPWIQSGLIQNNIINFEDIKMRITTSGLKNSSTQYIQKDSVLIAITGATCANIAFLTAQATANQSVIAIETIELNSKYLYYEMQNCRGKLLSLQNGSAQGGLTLGYLQDFEITIPNMNTQKYIADVLTTLDAVLMLQSKKLDKLIEQRKALQQYLLTGIVRVM